MSQPAGQSRIPLSRLQLPHPISLQVFEDYEQAQRAVDYLSDREFPVQNVMIVGTELKQVERVTGRLTAGRILASGAASGAWMGAFFGLLMWAFVQGGGPAQFITAMLVGAIFGMIWALILYRFTGGARDFTSVSQVIATRYEVLVEAEFIGQARALLEDQRRGVPNDAGREPQSAAPGGSAGAPDWGSAPPAGPPAQPPYGLPGGPSVAGPAAGGTVAGAPGVGGPGGAHYPPPGVPPVVAEPPRYRTYGEALDAERAARQQPSQGPTGGAGGGTPSAPAQDDAAAEDAHDVPGAQAQPQGEGRDA